MTIVSRLPNYGVVASATFTPSASAYGAVDIIDVAKEAAFTYADTGNPVPAGSFIRVYTTILRINQTALQASEGAYVAHLFNVTPPSAQADNAAFTVAAADMDAYLGSLALGTPVDVGGISYIKTQYTAAQDFRLLSSSAFIELVTTPAFTPGAVARKVEIWGMLI